MRTLTPIADQERQSLANDVYWLVEIEAPGNWLYYSNRPLYLDSRVYEPRVIEIKGLDWSLSGGSAALPRVKSQAGKLLLINSAAEGERLETVFQNLLIPGAGCRIGLFFSDKAHSATLDDIVYFPRCVIEAIEYDLNTATIFLSDMLSANGKKVIGRILSSTLCPGLYHKVYGRALPVIFGQIDDCPLLPYRTGPVTRLSQELNPEDKIALVDDTAEFPEQGQVQIRDEIIKYQALDRENKTLGTFATPLVRTEPGYHPANSEVQFLPEDGAEFVVSDHPASEITEVRTRNGWLVSPDEYQLRQIELAGRIVQTILFPQFPYRETFSSSVQTLRIDGRYFERQWEVAEDNSALEPEKAIDPVSTSSAAIINKMAPRLALKFLADLSSGRSKYGELTAVRAGIVYSASRRWQPDTTINFTVANNINYIRELMERPRVDQSQVEIPAHSHRADFDYQLDDSRRLFQAVPDIRVVKFDEVSGETYLGGDNYYWQEAYRAKDDDFTTAVLNFSGPGVAKCTEPLIFRLRRKPMKTEAVEITSLGFRIYMDSAESGQKHVEVKVTIANKYSGSSLFSINSVARTYEYQLLSPQFDFYDLTDPATRFEVSSPDGSLIRIYEAWLEIGYQPKLTGRHQALALRGDIDIKVAEPLLAELPTPQAQLVMDITYLVKQSGGWQFFSSMNGYPKLSVDFYSPTDDTQFYIQQVFLEVDYRVREKVEVATEFLARVSGIEGQGQLVENPADVVQYLLTSADFYGLDNDWIDEPSFAEVRQRLAAVGYKSSFWLPRPMELSELLESALFEARCRLLPQADKFKLQFEENSLSYTDVAYELGPVVLLPGKFLRKQLTDSQAINKVQIYYDPQYPINGSGIKYDKVITVAGTPGAEGAERVYRCLWHGGAAEEVIYDLANHIIVRANSLNELIDVFTPLICVHLEPTDVVKLNYPEAGLDSRIGELAGLQRLAANRLGLKILLPGAGFYCWQYNELVFIRHLPGNVVGEIFIQGQRVATFDWRGQLKLKGEVIEQGLQPAACETPITYNESEGLILFSCGSPGSYQSCFAIDSDGNLLIDGEAQEGKVPEGIVMEHCYQATVDWFALSLDNQSAVLCYYASQHRLYVKGFIKEQAAL